MFRWAPLTFFLFVLLVATAASVRAVIARRNRNA